MESRPSPCILRVVDMHAAGEPVRIVESGYPVLTGATLLDKRREARDRLDHLRRRLMLEPRGHGGMYGVIPAAPTHPDAAAAVLFIHQEGYSTMCGHATIALGRWLVDSGAVPVSGACTAFGIEAPCGLVRVEVLQTGAEAPLVAFESVPSFASHLDQALDIAGYGRVRFDIAFGGAYYAILPASRLGLPFMTTPLDELVRAGVAITNAVRAALPIPHPAAPDLGFLYGTILTDDTELGSRGNDPSYNLCIFAEGQIDRSPTGSGVTARFALAAARGEIAVGQSREVRGVSGQGFVGTLAAIESTPGGVVARVRVAGRAYYTSRSEFIAEPEDPFADGFELPRRLGDP
ncbi:MAG: proline racemase family protein [Acetobacteraceae bacterium]